MMSVEGRPLDDTSLIRDAKAGDVRAYEQLVRSHQQVALRVAYLVIRDQAEAEDVTQEAFVKAYRALGRLDADRPFRPWILAIVRNEALNRRRRVGRQQRLQIRVASEAISGDAAQSPETLAIASDSHQQLLTAVECLPERYRQVVGLRFLAGLSEAGETQSPVGNGQVEDHARPGTSSPGHGCDRRGDAMTALEVLLMETGERIDWPAPDLSMTVTRCINAGSPRPRTRRWIPVVIAFAILVVGLVVLSPATRQAIADLLGVAGIQIELGSGEMETVGFELDLGEMVSLEAASAEAGFPILTPVSDQLPDPDGIFFSEFPMGGEITMTWAPSDSLPEVGDTGVGLLISQFQGDRDEGDYLKRADEDTEIDVVAISGNEGFWLSGAPHLLEYRDATGAIRHEVSRLAANVLIWEEGGVTFRIESNLGLEASLTIAKSMAPNR